MCNSVEKDANSIRDCFEKGPSISEKLLEILTCEQLSNIEQIFKCEKYAEGMTKDQFYQEIRNLIDSNENDQLYLDFFDLYEVEHRLTWNSTLKALLNAIPSESRVPITLNFLDIQKNELTKRDVIVKILPVETRNHFCYTVYSKYGKTGIYDANFRQLCIYNIIMTREDINRKDDERRKRNRWITDAAYLQDLKKIAVINSARSLVIYDVVGLKHIPFFLVLSLPNIPKCITYKFERARSNIKHIFIGDDSGSILLFSFIHSKEALFRKKHNDKLTLFYWEELNNEKDYVKISKIKDVHKDITREIIFSEEDNSLLTCSRDPKASVVKMFLDHKKPAMVYGMKRGASTMGYSKNLNLLLTGSPDGTIRLWNTLVMTDAIGILKQHGAGIKSFLLLEAQRMFLSCAKDGVVKLWTLDDQKCIQTIELNFPCLQESGKIIEWAVNCMFLGTQEVSRPSSSNSRSSSSNSESKYGIDRANSHVEKIENSIIWVSCCNFLGRISLTFRDSFVQKQFEMEKLGPPPKQNNIFIPSTWLLNKESLAELSQKVQCDIEYPEKFKEYEYISQSESLKRQEYRMKINQKIAELDKQKREMQENVARGAPYSALKLFDIESLSLSNTLAVHGKDEKNLMDKTRGLLVEANNKDQVFSELSSSRSRSSRSSVVEFDY